jgi:hypothetical protein
MSTSAVTQTSFDVKNLDLADLGKRRIEWANQSMPVLQSIRKEFIKNQPLKGIRVSACLHVTTETANLAITLRDGGADVVHFSVRELKEFLQQTELVHELEGRRMDRVTAKIAQKIRVLFEHDNVNSGAGQEKCEHHSRRATASDTATSSNFPGTGPAIRLKHRHNLVGRTCAYVPIERWPTGPERIICPS